MNKGDSKKAIGPRNSGNHESQRKISANKEQNLKEFKLQIDHEIAKCLDTLDRQGLKYLKETLRSSKIFDLDDLREETAKNDKTQKTKNSVKDKKNSQEIQEQILDQCDIQEDPDPDVTLIGANSSKPLEYQPPNKVKLQKFQQVIHEPLKPFSRKGTRSKLQPSSQIQDKITTEKHKLPHINNQSTTKIKDKSQIDMIINKISDLPQEKLLQLGKIIDQLEKNQSQGQGPQSARNQQAYMFKVQAGMLSNHSARHNSNTKKKQKATSLHDCIIKNKRGNIDSANNSPKNKEQEMGQQIDQEIQDAENIAIEEPKTQVSYSQSVLAQSKGSPLEKGKQDKTETLPKKTMDFNNSMTKDKFGFKKSGFAKNFPLSSSTYKKPLDIEISESRQADTIEMSQNKMVKLGKKKLGTNKVQIILVRNRGHPSIIGLTGIQFFNSMGKSIPITVQNVKSPNSIKVMKLFNGVNKTTNQEEMFTTVFKRDFEIQLEVPQKIGALKIWNYNKSQIQSQKQTDWIQIYINGKEVWQGLVQKGSYNELQGYQTNVQIEDGVKISEQSDPKSLTKDKKLEERKEDGKSQNEPMKKSFNLGTRKQSSKKKVDWLQTTLVEEKMNELKDKKQDQKPTYEQKRATAHVGRFSQIYDSQQSCINQPSKNLNQFNKKDSIEKNIHLKESFTILKKQQPRIKKQNSKKIEEQFDIFNSMAQNQVKDVPKLNKKPDNSDNKKDSPLRKPLDQLQEPSHIPEIMLEKAQNKNTNSKKTHEKSLDEFMNDSLFQQPNQRSQSRKQNLQKINRKPTNAPVLPAQIKEQPVYKEKEKEEVNLDDFLNQLDDLVGGKNQVGNKKKPTTNFPISIPELPKGSRMEIVIQSNWGDAQLIGLNKIQFFTEEGIKICPVQVKQSNGSQSAVFFQVFSHKKGINNSSSQWKCPKKGQMSIQLTFSKKFCLSLVRFWNYIGDRIHSMIGIKKVKIFFDDNLIFQGQIRKMIASSIQEQYKSCENILFTSSIGVMKKIMNNDWLSHEFQGRRVQNIIFKKTVEGFHRPNTKGQRSEERKIEQKKIPFKLPKRQCFEYDPPQVPCGYYIKIVLHSAWGDRSFIGLNGISIFDEKGTEIKNIQKLSQFPSALNTMPGYQGDKRILKNLFNQNNYSDLQENSWLSAQLSDIERMEKKSANTILLQLTGPTKISAINFYNYTRTPERGVRQLQIYVDKLLCYRGYLRKANLETSEIHTTINFTKQTELLQKINYNGYHQDNLCQDVAFYNQGRIQEVK